MNGKRLASLDAVRGFDMLFIMGGEGLVCAIAALFGCPDFHKSFGHVPWNGLQFMDLIFPTFLFLAGASFPFSCAKSMERGMSRKAVALRALRRGVTLILLGWFYQGLLTRLNFATFRIPSVLGYIGFGWMVAAWLYLGVRKAWGRLAVGAAILVGVTLVMALVPAPDAATFVWANEGWKATYGGFGTGPFSPVGNVGCWLDRVVLGKHALMPGMFDNEGLGGLLCSVVTATLGMFAGDLVRRGGAAATGRKALQLLGAGAVSLAAGLLLSLVCPVIKNLWSPSFVLVAGSYSFAIFALFYWLVDVKGWTKWSFFFRVIGMNSITIYLAQSVIGFGHVRDFFFKGVAGLCPELVGGVVMELGYVAVCWLFLYFLYKKQVFLKV